MCAYVCVCERERVKTVAVRCSVLQCEDYLKGATGRGDVDLCVCVRVFVSHTIITAARSSELSLVPIADPLGEIDQSDVRFFP